MTSKRDILKLYKIMLRESLKIPSYNYRKYAVRKIHDEFKENKSLTGSIVIEKEIKEAQRNLEIIKRQASIGQMYSTDTLVIENIKKL